MKSFISPMLTSKEEKKEAIKAKCVFTRSDITSEIPKDDRARRRRQSK